MSKWEQGWLWTLVILMLLALGSLVGALAHFQLLKSAEYNSDFRKQSIRRVRVPASRGLIMDRNATVLAENRPSYCVVIHIEELRQPGKWTNTMDKVEEVIDAVSDIIGRERVVTRGDIWLHIRQRLPLAFTAWHDLDHEAVARFEERQAFLLPGVATEEKPVRTYPLGSCAGHVLGYVSRKSPPKNDPGPYKKYYLPEVTGTSGIERVFDEDLAGEAGGYLMVVDATGYRHKEEHKRPAVPGRDITLAIDHRIQRLVEGALAGERGAGVILDPRSGDVLAMASSPPMDPNLFIGGISKRHWDRIRFDKRKPLLNRAISEIYPPGSTFKPVVAIAALEGGRARADTTFTCRGYFTLGRIDFNCFRGTVHGPLQVRDAIARSCNPYFCQLGLQCGYEHIYHMASALGLGSRTGFDLGYDQRGILPRRRSDGDTCNVSMGQGALAVTPLQMAVIAAALANQGTVYRPRLILRGETRGTIMNRMGWAAETMRIVRGGMYDVIQSDHGTGKRARVPGVEMAGKTGSAQYGKKSSGRTHAWMLCFAPFERPRYAMAMVIEDGESGGRTVAPRIGQIMQGIFQLDGTLM